MMFHEKLRRHGLPVPGSACKEPGSHYCNLTTSKKPEQTEKSTASLGLVKEGRTQSKVFSPRLDRQVHTGSQRVPV